MVGAVVEVAGSTQHCLCLPAVQWDRRLLSCSSPEEDVEAKNILVTCPHLFAELARRKLGLEPNTGLLAWTLNCLKASVPSVSV